MWHIMFVLLLLSFLIPTKSSANESHDIYMPQSGTSLNSLFRHNIDSKHLKGKRVIDVSLPVNYLETASEIKYPLIVVLDGELLFHSVSGLVKLQSMNSQMPEAIVVSIPNAPDSRRDMTPKPLNRKGEPLWFGGKEENYLSFIREEALPFIENKYRVSNFKLLIGLSPTASFTLHTFWKQPSLFSGYIAVNIDNFNAVGYGGESAYEKIVKSVKNQGQHKRYLYLSMPKGGVTRNPKILDGYNELTHDLAPHLDKELAFKWEVIDKKSYAAVLPAITSGLELVFPAEQWDVNYRDFISEEPNQTLSNIKTHFSKLNEQYGFIALPKGERFYNRNRLKRIVYVMIGEKRYAEAEDIMKYWLSFYPQSANAYDTFADLYRAQGRKNLELQYRVKALEFSKKNKDQRTPLFESALNQLKVLDK